MVNLTAPDKPSERVAISESDCCISLSIDDTNRLREKLGFKPLAVGKDAKEDKFSIPLPKEPTAAEIANQQTAARNKRARSRLLCDSRGLADILGEEEADLDPSAWVAKHRKTDLEKSCLSQQNSSVFGGSPTINRGFNVADISGTDKDYEEDEDLGPVITSGSRKRTTFGGKWRDTHAPLKVCHDISEFEQIHDGAVLTLKDKPIIREDGELDDVTVDELEEPVLIERQKQKAKAKELRKIARSVRGTYVEQDDGEVEYDDDGNLIKSDILAKYDQWIDRKGDKEHQIQVKGFMLQPSLSDEVFIDTIIGGSVLPSQTVQEQTLKSQSKLQSDFYATPLTTFRTRSDRRKPTTKRKPSNEVDWADVLGEEDESKKTLQSGETSRSKTVSVPVNDLDDINILDGKFQISTATNNHDGVTEDGEDIEDRILYDQLSRAIRFTARKNGDETVTSTSGSLHDVAMGIDSEVKMEAETSLGTEGHTSAAMILLPALKLLKKEEEDETEIKPEQKGGIQLTSTTEFCRSIQTSIEKLEMSNNEAYTGSSMYRKQLLTKVGTARSRGSKSIERLENEQTDSWSDDDHIVDDDGNRESNIYDGDVTSTKQRKRRKANDVNDDNHTEDEIDDVEEDNDVNLLRDQNLGNGVSAVLQLLKDRGELNTDVFRVGRRDKSCRPMHTSTGSKDIKLECRDAYGRVMTQKEAFRNISWIFHGKGPGKKKREAMLKKIQLERKLKKLNPIEESKTMKALERTKLKTDQPYMTLSHV